MIELTLAEVADAVGGTLHDGADPEARVTGPVEFDSRKIAPGGLFLALPGARVDGHDFAAQAVNEGGAVAALTARPVGVPAIVVEPKGPGDATAEAYANDADGSATAAIDALGALARRVVDTLASADRPEAERLTVVGVTGSAGKTSTKDLIASVLRRSGSTVAPPGSFNNEIGHPYTALRCTEETRYLVAEMSARNIGHIAHLARIAPPAVGVELNVGTAHLGEFGSRENIARAKGELVEALPAAEDGGVAVLNGDAPFVAAMAPRTRARVVTFSAAEPPAPGAVYTASDITLDDVARASFTFGVRAADGTVETHPVRLRVFGAHQVSNALAAAAVGVESGIAPAEVAAALSEHVTASANRMDVHTRADGVTLINDAYNANPDSMRAGIAALAYTAAARPEAKSWAVLGEMAELGGDALTEHARIGDELERYRVDHLVAVGHSEPVAELPRPAQPRGVTTQRVGDAEAAAAVVGKQLRRGDVVLVKASNSQGLWRVAAALQGPPEAPGGGAAKTIDGKN